jgi:hypothetical protein
MFTLGWKESATSADSIMHTRGFKLLFVATLAF